MQRRISQLKGVYAALGNEGLRQHSDADVRLLLAVKRSDLDKTVQKIESGEGTELHVLMKSQLEAETRDICRGLMERSQGITR